MGSRLLLLGLQYQESDTAARVTKRKFPLSAGEPTREDQAYCKQDSNGNGHGFTLLEFSGKAPANTFVRHSLAISMAWSSFLA